MLGRCTYFAKSGIGSFLVLSTGVVFGYYSLILKVDEEEFGGHGSLLQEGLFASVTLFLVHTSLPSP
jgi:hypothetical protein